MEKACASRAMALPIRPSPMIPTVAPVSSAVSGMAPSLSHRPARTYSWLSGTRCASASIRASVTSATQSFSTSGVLVTRTPCSFAASTSTAS